MKSYFIISFMFFVLTSFACDCVTQGIEGRYNSSDLVIKGKIISKSLYAKNDTIFETNIETGEIEKIIIKHDKKAYIEYTLHVIEKYKGKTDQKIIKIRTEAYSNCASHFEIESEYLIFATKKRKKYLTNLCSGNEIPNPDIERELLKLKKSTLNSD